MEKKKKFDETFSQMKTKINNFQILMENFETHLEKVNIIVCIMILILGFQLSRIEINPNLREKEKKFLIDYFDINKAKANKSLYEKNQGNENIFTLVINFL